MNGLSRIVYFLVVLAFASRVTRGQDESVEPPIKYRLEVDGKSHAITEGAPLKLSGSLTDPTITLLAEPTRDFRYGGIEFPYPRSFTFEADVDGSLKKSWTLSGSDFTISYFVLGEDISTEIFANEMVGRFGKANSSKSTTAVTLDGKKQSGIRVRTTLAGASLTTDIFRLNTGKLSKLLVLQDSLDGGRPSKEGQEVMAMLQKSLKIK